MAEPEETNGYSVSLPGVILSGKGRTGRILAILVAALVVWGLPWAAVLYVNARGFDALAKTIDAGNAVLNIGRENAAGSLTKDHAAILSQLNGLAAQLTLSNCLQAPADVRRRLPMCAYWDGRREGRRDADPPRDAPAWGGFNDKK